MAKTKTSKNNVFDEGNLGHMMSEVTRMLQQNPDMVKKVSKCVNNIFENDSLMSKLVSEINNDSDSDSEISESLDGQILSIKDSLDSDIADPNESKQ